MTTARALARLGRLCLPGRGGGEPRHVRPIVEDGPALTIVEGRHPVLEARAGSPVTPNDLALDHDARIVILTGPNHVRKSVYLDRSATSRSGQIGAFVPAREARIGVSTGVFTRSGAQDNLARGQSTSSWR